MQRTADAAPMRRMGGNNGVTHDGIADAVPMRRVGDDGGVTHDEKLVDGVFLGGEPETMVSGNSTTRWTTAAHAMSWEKVVASLETMVESLRPLMKTQEGMQPGWEVADDTPHERDAL